MSQQNAPGNSGNRPGSAGPTPPVDPATGSGPGTAPVPPAPSVKPPDENAEAAALQGRIAALEKELSAQKGQTTKLQNQLEEAEKAGGFRGPVSRNAKGDLFVAGKKVGKIEEKPVDAE